MHHPLVFQIVQGRGENLNAGIEAGEGGYAKVVHSRCSGADDDNFSVELILRA